MSSVASKNPFALLGEGGDDEAPAKASTKAKAPAPPAPAAPAKDSQKPRNIGPASRGGKYYQRGGSRGSAFRDGAGNPNQNGIEEPEGIPKKFEGRGRGRGGRGGPRGGKRPFDRHSATGKTDSEKKIHQGWGGDDGNTELQAEAAANKDAATESAAPNEWDGTANADAWGATADGAATEGAGADKGEGRPPRKEKEEEEDNTLTLEQYLAQQKDKDTVVPKLELRKANEGAAEDLWKDAVAIQKGDEDAYFVGKSKAAPKARAKKEEKVFIEIDGRFDRPSRGGRGGRGGERGGRGGGDRGGERGGRGRGAGRGGRGGRSNNGPAAPTFSVDDEAAFPSLT